MKLTLHHLRTAHPDGYVSGAGLAKRLGISRAAVWKQVQSLRRRGVRVDASPGLGYRLAGEDDAVLPETVARETAGCRVRWKVRRVAVLGSTQDEARRLASQGAPEGTVVVADRQSRGRGRLGRRWSSPEGGVWATLILRPRLIPARATLITLAAGLAVCEAAERLGIMRAGMKWPNDVLVGGRKLAGVLTEMSAEQDMVEWVLVGIGVNVWNALSAGLAGRATSLKREGVRGERGRVLVEILNRVDWWYLRLGDQVVREARDRSTLLGRDVTVTTPEGRIRGRAVTLDEEGALVLETAEGEHRVLGGEVHVTGRGMDSRLRGNDGGRGGA